MTDRPLALRAAEMSPLPPPGSVYPADLLAKLAGREKRVLERDRLRSHQPKP